VTSVMMMMMMMMMVWQRVSVTRLVPSCVVIKLASVNVDDDDDDDDDDGVAACECDKTGTELCNHQTGVCQC